jgi:FkbM family methyltransferase
VIAEVFVKSQYACLGGLTNVKTIVDAGANIGATSVYLLEVYPSAHVIAIEPDPYNFQMLQKNLADYGSRVSCLRSALWGTEAELRILRGAFRDGGEWSCQVTPSLTACESDVRALTVSKLMDDFNLKMIDILKVDIEGAEREVFRGSSAEWLRRTRTIAIELHDAECRTRFTQAIAPFQATVKAFGEVTCWRQMQTGAW